MTIDFGNLLREYRGRTRDPRTNRALTQSRLLELVENRSGLDLSPQSISRWERAATDFPRNQRDLLIDLVEILQAYGGIRSTEEANQLLDTAGYKPLDESEVSRIFYGDSGDEAPYGQVDVSQRTPTKGAAEDVDAPDLSDIDIDELLRDTEDLPAEPDTPTQVAEIERFGTTIQVSEIERVWRTPIDGLVLPMAATRDEVGGAFYEALLRDLDGTTADELYKLLREPFPKLSESNQPAAIRLPEELGRRVLPFSTDGRATMFITSLRGPSEVASIGERVEFMMTNLVQLAGVEGIQHLALPVIGSGPATPDQEKPAATTVATAMCEALLTQTDFGTLQSITIATIEPRVVESARRRFHALENNLSQALSNDRPATLDLLGIAPEVNALAEALALREVTAPLAVGIIGGWGSGKSSVMRLMWEHIARLRTAEVTRGWPDDEGDSEVLAFVGHIYQISFNAWTYAKSNLWASLMHEIFFELNRQLSLEQALAAHIDPLKGGRVLRYLYDEHAPLEQFLPQVDEGTLQVDGNLLWETLRARKQEDLKALQAKEEEIAALKAAYEDAIAKDQKNQLTALGNEGQQLAVGVLRSRLQGFLGDATTQTVQQFVESREDVNEAQLEAIFEELRGVRTTSQKMFQVARKGAWATVGFVAFALLVIVATFLLTQWRDWAEWQVALARIASFIPLLLPPLRIAGSVSRWIEKQITDYERQEAREREKRQAWLDERLAQSRAQQEETVQMALAAVEPTPEAQKSALDDLVTQDNLVAFERRLELLESELEEQLRKVGPTARYVSLLDFVRARLDEAYYEKRLGLMHQVQRDLEELTDGLTRWNTDDPEEMARRKELFPRGQPRAILYIDDLDRCPPPRVVEVMEAVQLLLSTELFVVVLGLDTRYITRALEKEYKEILQHEGDPSGMDYIEKIIQIPYRVRPIEPQGLAGFVEAQMEFEEVEETPSAAPIDVTLPPMETDDETRMPEEDETIGRRKTEASVVSSLLPPEPLPPEVIRFSREDFADLTACCRQVSLTPRSVKRLINVLKLAKIFWVRKQGHDERRAVKQTVIGLLALSAAYPEIMREAFVRLETGYRDRTKVPEDTVGEFLEGFEPIRAKNSAYDWQVGQFRTDVTALRKVKGALDAPPVDFLGTTLEGLTISTFNLVRSFSFVGDFTYTIER